MMKKHKRTEDNEISRNLKQPLAKIQKKMFDLSQKQEKKDWLIIFLNKHYIFYRQDIVSVFNTLLEKKENVKEILEKLSKVKIETRAEVLAIKETLLKLNRVLGNEE